MAYMCRGTDTTLCVSHGFTDKEKKYKMAVTKYIFQFLQEIMLDAKFTTPYLSELKPCVILSNFM